jgi:serine/threonine protein kinase
LRETEARGLADFLNKALEWEPSKRPSAADLLNHYWLKMIPNYNTKMLKEEHREYRRVNRLSLSPEGGDARSLNNDDVELSDGGFSDNEKPSGVPFKRKDRIAASKIADDCSAGKDDDDDIYRITT